MVASLSLHWSVPTCFVKEHRSSANQPATWPFPIGLFFWKLPPPACPGTACIQDCNAPQCTTYCFNFNIEGDRVCVYVCVSPLWSHEVPLDCFGFPFAGGSPTDLTGDPTMRVKFRADIWPDQPDVPTVLPEKFHLGPSL